MADSRDYDDVTKKNLCAEADGENSTKIVDAKMSADSNTKVEGYEENMDLNLGADKKSQDSAARGAHFDDQFEMQNDEDSPRMPIFVAGRSPRYVNQSPRKGDPGTLIYESASSPNVSSRVKLSGSFGATSASTAQSSHGANITIGSPGKNVLMSPLRFGHSPMSLSPPGGGPMISLEELKQVAETAANYKLVHEIAAEPDFKLSPRTVDPNSLEGKIKEVMERAFWDVLRDDLEQDEPNYEHALSLLQEIRQVVLEHLLKTDNCKQIAQKFRETIDIDLIKQQIEQGSFDIYQYSNFIIDTLSKVCAPCRDERMAELRKIKDVVLLFRELMKTLDLMKLDMANFLIAQSRPLFQQHSIEYERTQFDKFLATQKDQGLQYTREWLFRAKERLSAQSVPNNTPTAPVTTASPSPATASSSIGASSSGTDGRLPTGREILNEAFMELLDWREPIEKYPETCVLDVTRFGELSFEYRYLVLTASLLLVSLNVIGANANQMSSFVDNIKSILKDILHQSPGVKKPEDLLESFVAQIVKQLQVEGRVKSDEVSVKAVQGPLNALADDQHSVKNLLAKRTQRYLKIGLDSASHSNPASVPPALIPIQKELMAFTAKFLKIASYNREVFRPHYTNIIEDFTITID